MSETGLKVRAPYLVELAHDENCHPHQVEDAVEEHPEDPGRAGGDLRQVQPKAILGVASGTVHPPVWRREKRHQHKRRKQRVY